MSKVMALNPMDFLPPVQRKEDFTSKELGFFNVRKSVGDFTGRESVLQSLSEYFTAHSNVGAVHVLGAEAGMGKTQTVLEYVARNKGTYGKEGYERVFWVTAETIETLRSSLREFASKIDIYVHNKEDEDILKRVHEKLVKLPKTLFVFDNVMLDTTDNQSLMRKYLSADSFKNHHIIITTRNTDVGFLREFWQEWSNVQVGQLQAFGINEARDYIKHAGLDEGNESNIDALSRAFGNVPLDISHAVACIKENKYTIAEYLSRIKPALESLGEDESSQAQNALLVDIEKVRSMNPKAAEIVTLCSFLHADKIPVKIFSGMFTHNEDLLEAVTILEKNKLITVERDGNLSFIYIHRRHQEDIRNDLKETGKYDSILLRASKWVHENMADSLVGINAQEVMGKNLPLLNHAVSVISHFHHKMEGSQGSVELKNQADLAEANLYMDNGVLHLVRLNYDEAHKMFNAALEIREKILGYNHLDIAVTLTNIARVFNSRGLVNQALEKYEQALEVRKSILGPDDVLVSHSISSVARVYFSKGELSKARAMFLEALRIRESKLNQDDSIIVLSKHDIGMCYLDEGKLDDALKMFQEVLRIQKLTSQDYAPILNDIGRVYQQQKNYTQAEELFKEALQIRESALWHDHPDVASSLNHIGGIYHDRGDFAKALDEFYEARRIFVGTLGEESLDVSRTLDNIGRVYRDQGDLTKALAAHMESLRIKKLVAGHDFPSVAASLCNIAKVYELQQDFGAALENFTEALRIRKLTLDNDHKSVLSIEEHIMRVKNEIKEMLVSLKSKYSGLDLKNQFKEKEEITQKLCKLLDKDEQVLELPELIKQTQDVDLYYLVGMAYASGKKLLKAASYFEKALESPMFNGSSSLIQAKSYAAYHMLCVGVTTNNVELVTKILKNVKDIDVDFLPPGFHVTPLYMAADNPKAFEIQKMLIDSGASPIICSGDGLTPLHVAFGCFNKEFLEKVCENLKALRQKLKHTTEDVENMDYQLCFADTLSYSDQAFIVECLEVLGYEDTAFQESFSVTW